MITKMAFVAHPTKNMDQAKKFYEEVLGLKLAKTYAKGAWLEYDLPDGKTLAIETFSNEGPYLALETDNIESEIAGLKERGANVLKDVWENKEPDGKSVCKMSIIADPDGNQILLHEMAAHRR